MSGSEVLDNINDLLRRLAAALKERARLDAELDRTLRELDKARSENMCDACAGKGTPTSGPPCMCGGTGKMSDAACYLREQMVAALKERDEARAEAERQRYHVATQEETVMLLKSRAEAAETERDRLRAALEPTNIAAALYTIDHGDWSRASAHWRRWSLEKAGRLLAAIRARAGLEP